QEAEERARIDAARAAEKQARREEWTRRLRNVGNIAASIGIITIAAAGADRIVGWSSSGSQSDAAESAEDPVQVDTPRRGESDGAERSEPGVADIGVLPPAVDDSGLDLDEIEVDPVREVELESDRLSMVLRNAVDSYRLTAEEFVTNQRTCADVQAEFVAVDGAWMNYSMARAAELADASLEFDGTRVRRDEELTGLVREIESAFAATGCPRP
ncbi:MAG: hypothetical protein M8841_03745, partial [marine benthic group bacterium]|nr:hypothetical protein [Gemmatimonadota bacterium]